MNQTRIFNQKIKLLSLTVLLIAILSGCNDSTTPTASTNSSVMPNTQGNNSNLQKGIQLLKEGKYDEASLAVILDITSNKNALRNDVSKILSDEYSVYYLASAKDPKSAADFSLQLTYLNNVRPIDGFITEEDIEKLKTPLKPSIEKDIYKFERNLWDKSTVKDPNKAEALIHIQTSKEFNKPIIEVYRAVKLVDLNLVQKKNYTEAEIDTIGVKWLKDLGFVEKSGNWYYEDQVVNMGTPLPVPDSMKHKQPEDGKAIQVSVKIQTDVSEQKSLIIKGETNLPDNMKLAIGLVNPDQNYSQKNVVTVQNGQFTSNPFSDSNRTLGRLAAGKYTVKIESYVYEDLDDTTKSIVGDKARNLVGKDVIFDIIYGNKLKFSQIINIP